MSEIPVPPQRIRYDPQFKEEIDKYIEECKKDKATPTVKGFAQRIGTDEQSIWAWANKKRKDERGNLTDKLARPQFLSQVNKLKALEIKQAPKIDIVKLSKPEKKVAAKVLRQQGFTAREIEQMVGLSDNSVLRAENLPTPEDLTQFEVEFKTIVLKKKLESLPKVLKRMDEIIPKYKRLDHLVKAGEYYEGIRAGNTTNLNVNQTIQIIDLPAQ